VVVMVMDRQLQVMARVKGWCPLVPGMVMGCVVQVMVKSCLKVTGWLAAVMVTVTGYQRQGTVMCWCQDWVMAVVRGWASPHLVMVTGSQDLVVGLTDLVMVMDLRDLVMGLQDLVMGSQDLVMGLRDLVMGLQDLATGLQDLVMGLRDLVTGLRDLVMGLRDLVTDLQDLVMGLQDLVMGLQDLVMDPQDLVMGLKVLVTDLQDLATYLQNQVMATGWVGLVLVTGWGSRVMMMVRGWVDLVKGWGPLVLVTVMGLQGWVTVTVRGLVKGWLGRVPKSIIDFALHRVLLGRHCPHHLQGSSQCRLTSVCHCRRWHCKYPTHSMLRCSSRGKGVCCRLCCSLFRWQRRKLLHHERQGWLHGTSVG
jgi:hypothetical protein